MLMIFHHPRKNLRMLQLLSKMQLQILYTPVELRPHVYVPEEFDEFFAREARVCHQEGGELVLVPILE
jgi:hypothetical protein